MSSELITKNDPSTKTVKLFVMTFNKADWEKLKAMHLIAQQKFPSLEIEDMASAMLTAQIKAHQI